MAGFHMIACEVDESPIDFRAPLRAPLKGLRQLSRQRQSDLIKSAFIMSTATLLLISKKQLNCGLRAA
jgi:hypothetical protein